MATFPLIQPTYGTRKNSTPNVRVTRLGDGYEFRALFGLPQNQDPKIYDLTFNVTEVEADVIEAFLRSRVADQASFTFTPPAEGFSNKGGTFIQSNGAGATGKIVTVSCTNHGVAIGDTISVTANSGGLANGDYVVSAAANQNTFTINSAANAHVTSQTSITFDLSGAGKFVCEQWSKSIPFRNRAVINCSFREVFEP
tara:strand:- start:6130 stop:6723 length:594 start_codon:yes stop_codon:yes gene_type:complete